MLVFLPAPIGVGIASVGADAVPVSVVVVVAVTSVAARLVTAVVIGPLLGSCVLSLVIVCPWCCVMCVAGSSGATVVASIAGA